MYDSLLLPWTSPLSPTTPPFPRAAELAYRAASPQLVRTKGTIFLPPPSDDALRRAFHAPPRPRSRMSAGAVALTKHFERNPRPERHPRVIKGAREGGEGLVEGEGEAEGQGQEEAAGKRGGGDGYKAGKRREGDVHPFWAVPRGSNEEKTRVAGEVLEGMLRSAKWRNVMLLHEGVAVYEVRVGKGWGMRWTLGLGRDEESEAERQSGGQEEHDVAKAEEDMEGWRIASVTFRGFLEPIAGLDHELDPDDGDGGADGGSAGKGSPEGAMTEAIKDPATT